MSNIILLGQLGNLKWLLELMNSQQTDIIQQLYRELLSDLLTKFLNYQKLEAIQLITF